MRCELDCDAFDAPMDARVYLDYKNNSDRAVSAVKFRLRFVDGEQKDRGTFHVLGPAAAPQGVGGVKAKRDITLHPSIVGLKVRVLAVKYSDGSDWSSVKMQELVQPGGASTSSGSVPSLPSAVNSAPMIDESADMPARGGATPPPAAYSTPPAAYSNPPAAYSNPPAAYSTPPAANSTPPASQTPYSTGVRGKTYEVAPPGATQSYSSLNGAAPAFNQAAPAMPQAKTVPDASATVAPFYTPPPTPKMGLSPVFNPLNEPDSTGAPSTSLAPAQAVPSSSLPASQASSPSKAQMPATTAPSQAPKAQAAPAAQNNVFAASPMAASDGPKQPPQQVAAPSKNAFAAGAPGATYAPAINAANAGQSFAGTAGATAPAASLTPAAQAVANPSTNTNTSTNTSTAPASTGSNKGPEPINTPWHP